MHPSGSSEVPGRRGGEKDEKDRKQRQVKSLSCGLARKFNIAQCVSDEAHAKQERNKR